MTSNARFSAAVLGCLVWSIFLTATTTGQDSATWVVPSKEAIDSRIQAIESSTDLDDALKTRILEIYRQARVHANDYRTYTATLASDKQLAESGPQRIKTIRQDLEKPPATPDLRELQDASSEKLKDLTRQKVSELNGLKDVHQQRVGSISAQDDRPQKLREELTRARERLKTVEAERAAPLDPNEHQLLREARLESLLIRNATRSAEIQMLEQENVIYQLRLDLWKAERDGDQRAIGEAEAYLRELEELASSRTQEEAEKVKLEAEIARREAEGKHPALLAIAEENERLSGDNARMTELVERVGRDVRNVESELKVAREEYSNAEEKLKRVGLSGVLGEVFIGRRRKLPDRNRYRKQSAQRQVEIARLRAEQVRKEETRRSLDSIDRVLEEILLTASPTLEESDLSSFSEEARVLLKAQHELLRTLDSTYSKSVTALGELDYQDNRLSGLYSDYADFLDEHLLWTPSTTILDGSRLKQVPSEALRFFSLENRKAVLDSTKEGLRQNLASSLFTALGLLTLLVTRRGFAVRLSEFGDRVGKRYADSFLLTLGALGCTIAIAAPIALTIAALGWSLTTTLVTSSFARAVGQGLLTVGGVLLALKAISVFCSPRGVAAVHFKWNERALSIFRRNLIWLTWCGLPLLFVVRVTESLEDESLQNTLGRSAFVCGMVLIALFSARVLAPKGGVLARTVFATPNGWLYRLRHILYGGAMVLPLAIAILAILGYYYTALQLDDRVFLTILTVLGGMIVYHLVLRWLLIARKRLAVLRARERRAIEVAAQGEEANQETAVDLDIPEIDLATIKKQSQGIFRAGVVIGVLVSLAFVWVDVLPALGVLDRELWQVRIATAGEETLRSITIGTLLFSVAIGLFSVISSKNLPGLLEISALRNLPIDPGSRYAVATIGQYLVLAVGFILSFQIIGVGWAHIQWLVAALTVGLGFGLQEIFANFISGLIILLERPIRVGDTVTIGDITGTVSRIRIRATTITDWDQKELVVPNKSFITGQLVNWSLSNPVTRLMVKVGIEYGSDTQLALKLMLRAAHENPKALDDPEPAVFFVGFGDSSLDFEVRVFVKELSNRGRTRVVHDLHMAIDRSFREHGVVIAFPQRDLHFRSDSRFEGGSPSHPNDDTGID